MINSLEIDISAFRIIVKYVMKARIFPTSDVPWFTRKAPVRITATRPRFKSTFMTGLVMLVVTVALRSQSTTSRFA